MSVLNTQQIGRKSGGFSLVEVMVGMAIGLLGMLVMMQMLAFSESQKRTTASSGDVQNTGAIALYGIERDIQQSGYNFDAQHAGTGYPTVQGIIGCSMSWTAKVDGRSVTLPLAPVSINSNAVTLPSDANSDTVLVMYGSSSSPEEGDTITAEGTDSYAVATPTNYSQNDYVVAQYAVRPHPCALTMTKITTAAGSEPVAVTTGTGVVGLMTTNTNSSGATTPNLYDLGGTPTVRAYSVNNGSLTACDYLSYDCAHYAGSDTAHWVPIAANIVSLKAQYGRDTNAGNMNGDVDTYDQTTPPVDTSTAVYAPIIQCQWARIASVRIALVAEGAQSGATVNTAEPTWDGSAAVAGTAGSIPTTVADPINLATAAPNWANYHLKVFQTTVPIRNIIMQGVVTGC